jgi:hypothetical protein
MEALKSLPNNTLNLLIKRDNKIVFNRFVVLPTKDISLEVFDNLVKSALEDVRKIVDTREM